MRCSIRRASDWMGDYQPAPQAKPESEGHWYINISGLNHLVSLMKKWDDARLILKLDGDTLDIQIYDDFVE